MRIGQGSRRCGGSVPGRGPRTAALAAAEYYPSSQALEPEIGLLGSAPADPNRPIRTAEALHWVRKQMFSYSKETSGCFSCPAEYSGGHFGFPVSQGERAALNWALNCFIRQQSG